MNEANRGTNTGPGGFRGMLLRKIFENLLISVAILVLPEQFLGKFCIIFLPLILMCVTIGVDFFLKK